MNRTTIAIIAATLATNAAAYEVTAPPDVVAAAKLSGELSRDVLDFGPRCRLALVHDFDDKTPCAIIGQISARMIEPAKTVHTWLTTVRKQGATTVSNLPDVIDEMNEASDMLGTLVRLSQYGS
jgi:hypothetical protein